MANGSLAAKCLQQNNAKVQLKINSKFINYIERVCVCVQSVCASVGAVCVCVCFAALCAVGVLVCACLVLPCPQSIANSYTLSLSLPLFACLSLSL